MTASAGTVMSGMARTLGAPGVFVEALPPRDTLTGVRRDIAAFAGVAPRGPSRVAARALAPDDDVAAYLTTGSRLRSIAVPVESWGEYQRLFGAYEGAGRLPYAVAAFFANGGRRAYIVRIVAPSADDAAGCAAGVLCTGRVDPAGVTRYTPVPSSSAPEIVFRSRNEGVWGDRLRVVLRCSVRPLPALVDLTGTDADVVCRCGQRVGSGRFTAAPARRVGRARAALRRRQRARGLRGSGRAPSAS